ncbi:MAG: SLC13 family permease [Jatrophihabitantaceae bacterium]
MHGAPAEIIAIALLAMTLAVAIARPWGLSEAVVAVPAAGLVVVTGIVPAHNAGQTLRDLGPTVGFLAAILVFGHLCAEDGVFDYLGSVAARASRAQPRRLLAMVVVLAASVTAVLTLDATVVLLTPVVLAVTARIGVPTKPHVYVCTRLANSGSLLLPVSNLTNLLAFTACGLSFGRFAALMVLPWLVVCAGEWLGLRLFFRADLPRSVHSSNSDHPAPPRYALLVLAVTVVGFVLLSSLHVAVAWAAVTGCVLLLLPRLARRQVSVLRLASEASPGFCLFVFALAIVVDGVVKHGLGSTLTHVVPHGTSLWALLGVAFVAALLANVLNNLPAILVLLTLVTGNPALILAALIGVNVGPNATYGGSLATLLWRRLLPAAERPNAREFHLLGVLTVPVLLVLGTLALWAAVSLVGV